MNLLICLIFVFCVNWSAYGQDFDLQVQVKFAPEVTKNVRSAVFKLNNQLWIVFDAPSLSIFPQKIATESGITYDNKPQYTIIRQQQENTIIPQIYIKDDVWYINFLKTEQDSAKPYCEPIKINNDQDILIKVPYLGKSINFTDSIGNQLLVLPAPQNSCQIKSSYEFIRFNLKQSYNGILIAPKANDLDIKLTAESALIRNVTFDLAKIDVNHDVLFPFTRWLQTENKNYYDSVLAMRRQIVKATNTSSAYHYRFRLVEFYLANQLPEEAIALLEETKRLYPELPKDSNFGNQYNLLSFVSKFLTRDYSTAGKFFQAIDVKKLSSKSLTELMFWRDAMDLQQGKSNVTMQYLQNVATFLPYYLDYKKKLAFIALKAAIYHQDSIQAEQIYNILSVKKLTVQESNYLSILQAEILALKQKFDDAQKIYEHIEQLAIDDPQNRALATYSKVKLLRKNNKITLDDAIKELERLLIVWRGDDFDPKLRMVLADLYIENKNYFDGLNLLRNTAIFDDNNANLLAITEKMNDTFVNLFYRGAADSMSIFTSTALFYNFRELTPIGKLGIAITLKLIDQLVELDLIERATFFLNHLVRYRIQDDKELPEQALKLVKLYCNNRQIDNAFEVIKENRQFLVKNFADELKFTQAELLLSAKRYKEALLLIKGDNSDRANKLFSDILWQEKNFLQLKSFLQPKLEYRDHPPQKLSALEQEYAFRLAACYFQSGEMTNVVKLYDAFHEMMNNKFFQNALNHLRKMAYTDSPASLENYLKQISDFYQKISNSVLNDKFIQQFGS